MYINQLFLVFGFPLISLLFNCSIYGDLPRMLFSFPSASSDLELNIRKPLKVLISHKHIHVDFIDENLVFLPIHDEITEYGLQHFPDIFNANFL